MKRNLLLSALLLLASYVAVSAQSHPLPKLLTMREQQLTREAWLKKRLDTLLLPMMRRHKIEMWIVTNEEFHADPVTAYIAPPLPYVGRRDFFVFADRGGDKLDRIAVVPLLETSRGHESLAAIFGSYAVFSEEDHAASVNAARGAIIPTRRFI